MNKKDIGYLGPIKKRIQMYSYPNLNTNKMDIGAWVGTQRQAKIKGTLSDERINKLEDAGIIWSVTKPR